MLQASTNDLSINKSGKLSENQIALLTHKIATHKSTNQQAVIMKVLVTLIIGGLISVFRFNSSLNTVIFVIVLAIGIIALYYFYNGKQNKFYSLLEADLVANKVDRFEANSEDILKTPKMFFRWSEDVNNNILQPGIYYRLPLSKFIVNTEALSTKLHQKLTIHQNNSIVSTSEADFAKLLANQPHVKTTVPFARLCSQLLAPIVVCIITGTLVGMYLKIFVEFLFSPGAFESIPLGIVIILVALGLLALFSYIIYILGLHILDLVLQDARTISGAVTNFHIVPAQYRRPAYADFTIGKEQIHLSANESLDLVENGNYIFFIFRYTGKVIRWMKID